MSDIGRSIERGSEGGFLVKHGYYGSEVKICMTWADVLIFLSKQAKEKTWVEILENLADASVKTP